VAEGSAKSVAGIIAREQALQEPPQPHRSIDSQGTFLLQSICSELKFLPYRSNAACKNSSACRRHMVTAIARLMGLLSNDVTMVQVKGL
jgi:hypothetical protein